MERHKRFKKLEEKKIGSNFELKEIEKYQMMIQKPNQ